MFYPGSKTWQSDSIISVLRLNSVGAVIYCLTRSRQVLMLGAYPKARHITSQKHSPVRSQNKRKKRSKAHTIWNFCGRSCPHRAELTKQDLQKKHPGEPRKDSRTSCIDTNSHAEMSLLVYRDFLARMESVGPARKSSPMGKARLMCWTALVVDLLRPRRRPRPADQCRSPASKSR
jgi:hypothetical protein